MWVGRATVFLVGLTVILALVLGVASMALGANGNPLILGKAKNTASKVTELVKRGAGPALSTYPKTGVAGRVEPEKRSAVGGTEETTRYGAHETVEGERRVLGEGGALDPARPLPCQRRQDPHGRPRCLRRHDLRA